MDMYGRYISAYIADFHAFVSQGFAGINRIAKQYLAIESLPLQGLEVLVAVGVISVTTLVLLCCWLCKKRKDGCTAKVWLESKLTAQQQHWHKDKKLRDAVSSFHQRYARVPARLDAAREGHTKLIEDLLYFLRQQGINVHPEYVGSAYEGVKVARDEGNDDLEFDVLVTTKLPDRWQVHVHSISDRPGHVHLTLSENNYCYSPREKKTFFDEILTFESSYSWEGANRRYILDGRKAIDKFFGELQSWVNASRDRKEKILLRRHGPAVQMDVYAREINSDRPYYTVDVVPALEIESLGTKLIYVAKPIKVRILPDLFAWRPLAPKEMRFRGNYSDKRIDRFTPAHLRYMLEIEKHLRYRLRFAGHKVGANDDNLEFKVLVIDDGKTNQVDVSEIKDKPGFFRLNRGIGQVKERLNSRRETTSLVNALQQRIMNSSLLNGKVHIRRDGTVVRLIVSESDEKAGTVDANDSKTPLYYVDMMLAVEIGGGLYVARPNEDWYAYEMENSKAWRLSFSTEAKNAMYGRHGCMKMVLRVLKVLRNREVALAPLTSYHLKTVLLWLISESDSPDWNERYLGERLMDALLRLEKCLKEKNLPHFYLPGVNLTSHMVEDCISSMGCRIHVLCTKEKEMTKALQALI